MKKKESIKQAVLANHGGMTDATDDQIFATWHSLDTETQLKYLNNSKQKEKANATGNKSTGSMHN